MDPNLDFKKYILYSLSFHALVLILLFFIGNQAPVYPEPKMQVTMLRLTRGTAELENPPVSNPIGQGGPTAAPPQQKETPPIEVQKAPPPPIEKPVVKTPPVKEKTAPQKIAKENPKTVNLNQNQAKPKKIPPAPVPKVPSAPSPNDQKISQALSQVNQDLKEREAQEKATSPGTSSGSGAGPSPGYGNPNGEVTSVDPEKAQYQSQVRSKIIKEWIRTSAGEQTQVLRATILLRINASGVVISKSLGKKSGDGAFDNSALRAVERASPLPPPPENIKGEALSEGFIVSFSSRMLGRN